VHGSRGSESMHGSQGLQGGGGALVGTAAERSV
jgi:hypothetical protein